MWCCWLCLWLVDVLVFCVIGLWIMQCMLTLGFWLFLALRLVTVGCDDATSASWLVVLDGLFAFYCWLGCVVYGVSAAMGCALNAWFGVAWFVVIGLRFVFDWFSGCLCRLLGWYYFTVNPTVWLV